MCVSLIKAGAGLLVIGFMTAGAWAGNLKVFYPAIHTGWVLETPSGKVYVIDPGNAGEFYDTDSSSGMGIGTYLRKQGIKTVDGLVITHPHGDHYDAGAQLLQDFNVLELLDTGFNPNNNSYGGYDSAFWSAFKASGAIRRTGLHYGDVLNWDPELTVKVCGPKDPFWTYEEAGSDPERYYNQNSMVLWIEHGDVSYMFTGDITAPAQNFVRVNSRNETKATSILAIPHHGKWYFGDGFAGLVGTDHPFVRIGVISESHNDLGDVADQFDEWQGAGLLMYAGDGNNRVSVISTGGHEFLLEATNPAEKKIFNTLANYSHEPYFTATGENYLDLAYNPASRLNKFSAAAWFRTSASFSGPNRMIINKGGFNSEVQGQNMNFGIWMRPSGQVEAGFETASGTDVFAATPGIYNNEQWHHAVATYDQAVLKLYIDAALVRSVTNTMLYPDTFGTGPVRVGADAGSPGAFFVGSIDEARVWNRALSSGEVWNAYYGGRVNLDGLVAELDMGCQKLYGTNYLDQASSPQLQLTNFVLDTQFRTTAPPPAAQVAMIVNKGGFGSDVTGQNMNYGIWIDSNGYLVGGFEAAATGADIFATSARTVNDGLWHTAAVSYDGSALVLTLDGVEAARTATSAIPDTTGTQPLRTGANSRGDNRYFTGDVDYVRLVNPEVGTVFWTQLKASEYQLDVPRPVITSWGKTNFYFSVTVRADAGIGYALWRAPGLGSPTWAAVTNAIVTTNAPGTVTLTDTNATFSQSFYRVMGAR